jgi:methylmalonyl-CoA mutase cobalamin-binding subunit
MMWWTAPAPSNELPLGGSLPRITSGSIRHADHRVGLDIAKNMFQRHGIDAAEKVVVRKQLRRSHVMPFLRDR